MWLQQNGCGSSAFYLKTVSPDKKFFVKAPLEEPEPEKSPAKQTLTHWPNKFLLPLPTSIGPIDLSTYFLPHVSSRRPTIFFPALSICRRQGAASSPASHPSPKALSSNTTTPPRRGLLTAKLHRHNATRPPSGWPQWFSRPAPDARPHRRRWPHRRSRPAPRAWPHRHKWPTPSTQPTLGLVLFPIVRLWRKDQRRG